VFDVREGWEPLCEFLDVPVPDTPFPNINDASEVKFVFNTIRVLIWMTTFGVPSLLAYGLFNSTSSLPLYILLVIFILWGAGRLAVVAVSNQTSKYKEQ